MTPARTTAAWLLTAVVTSASPTVAAADLPTAGELLARSIRYHDPDGNWGRTALELSFDESRPDGSVRRAEVLIDAPNEIFSWVSQRDGREVSGRLDGDGCVVRLDGEGEVSPEDAAAFGLDCATVARRRDYYTYLWGLPMKLRDPGTRIDDEVVRTEFEGREVLALRVTYDEAVGSDTWYFYFDPATAALAGYRFFHDESLNDGEYITLEGEARVAGMRLPRTRAWYYNKDDGYLGTDTLVAADSARFVRDGILISLGRPALALDLTDDLTYVGRHSFTIRDVAAGERFVFVEATGERVDRLFLVQFEAFLPGSDEIFRYDLGGSPEVAGYRWRSNGFAFDLSDARASDPANESSLTAAFLEKRGYELPDQWMMWRSLTVTDAERKSEVILFYVEDVAGAGLTLDDLYQNDTATEVWKSLQRELAKRANASFALTRLGEDGEPVTTEWASIPN